jgi:hypothetical protein
MMTAGEFKIVRRACAKAGRGLCGESKPAFSEPAAACPLIRDRAVFP